MKQIKIGYLISVIVVSLSIIFYAVSKIKQTLDHSENVNEIETDKDEDEEEDVETEFENLQNVKIVG